MTAHLLIVDDNPRMRRLLRSMLGSLFDRFSEAANGSEAIALYKDGRPDLVLMDVRMPEMDGIEAAANIINCDPRARVIMISDYGDEAYRRDALRAGAEGYFLKERLDDVRAYLEWSEG